MVTCLGLQSQLRWDGPRSRVPLRVPGTWAGALRLRGLVRCYRTCLCMCPCLFLSSLALGSLTPSCGPGGPDCLLLFPQRQGTGTYLNMSWSEFFQKTGVR